ncbi:MAG: electron transfer flavoprotein subunit beta/FixA family protein [Burkholderiaceae bacterium]|nr:electron transfer flavoprotein subunit beta/FixA family protein [Microbacteriaceae bacterium]
MKIMVLVKQVPDTWGERTLDLTTGWVDRAATDRVIDEIGERALEVALSRRDANKGTEVVVVTMGPAECTAALRKALSMGADSAIHVLDDALAGADLGRTARAIAAAVSGTGFDLIVAGNESTDGRGGVLPAMVAELLRLPHLGSLDSVELTDSTVGGLRSTEHGTATVHAALPAIVSITESLPEARFPSFKGILTAKKKPISQLSLADLGSTFAQTPGTVIRQATAKPPRTAGTITVDSGTAAAELAEFLIAARLVPSPPTR